MRNDAQANQTQGRQIDSAPIYARAFSSTESKIAKNTVWIAHFPPIITLLSLVLFSESAFNAVINSNQLQRSIDIVDSIDYLPDNYAKNGCHARGYYISMELAANSIPSTQVFVARTDRKDLQIGEIEWEWHVAPLVRLSRKLPAVVIDPALALATKRRSKFYPFNGWLKNFSKYDSVHLLQVPGSTQLSSYIMKHLMPTKRQTPAPDAGPQVQDFASFPGFLAEDIRLSCTTILRNLKRCSVSDELYQIKKQKIIERTSFLLQKMEVRAKFKAKDDYIHFF